MTCTDFPHPAPTTARPDDSILFAALELSRKSWLVATSAPGEEKVSKRTVSAGDGRALLDLLAGLREKAERRIGKPVKVVGLTDWTVPDIRATPDLRAQVQKALDQAYDDYYAGRLPPVPQDASSPP